MTNRSNEQNGQRVLVVEDDPSIRRALGRAFRSIGYDVEFAANLAEGQAKLNGHQVVLLDLQLPDGSGTALLQRIRRERSPIRVAIYSGLLDAPAVIEASGERPDAIFEKPVDFDLLMEWLAQVPSAL